MRWILDAREERSHLNHPRSPPLHALPQWLSVDASWAKAADTSWLAAICSLQTGRAEKQELPRRALQHWGGAAGLGWTSPHPSEPHAT